MQGFDARLEDTNLSIKETPQDQMRTRDSEQVKTVLASSDQDIEQKDIFQDVRS